MTTIAIALSLFLSSGIEGRLHLGGSLLMHPNNDITCANPAQDVRWKKDGNDFFIWCEDRKS